MLHWINRFYICLINIGTFLQSFVLLAIRLLWGWQFFVAGRDKLMNITPVIDYFQSLHLPIPTISAYAAASTECIGGLCLLIGFASRLASLPLMVVMIIAAITAHYNAFINAINNYQDFIQITPFSFFLASLIIFAFGPGMFSIDAIIKRFKKG